MRRDSPLTRLVTLLVFISLISLPLDVAGHDKDTIKIAKEKTFSEGFSKITPIKNIVPNEKEERIALLVTKYSPDYHEQYNCNSSECYTGSACVSSPAIYDDNYCVDGNWTTRTKLMAMRLLDIVMKEGAQNYSLFCDEYRDTLNYLDHPPGLNFGQRTHSFCVLKYYDNTEKVVVAASLKHDSYSSYDTSLQEVLEKTKRSPDYCDGLEGFGSCEEEDVWYDPEKHLLFFSKEDISFPSTHFHHTDMLGLLQPILDLLGVDPFQDLDPVTQLIENASYFNKLFILSKGEKSVFALLEKGRYLDGDSYDFLTVRYQNFYSDICLSVDGYSGSDAKVHCNPEGLSDYLITAQQDIGKYDGEGWLQLTAQIRAEDVPDLWPPRIHNAWIEPRRGYQYQYFCIYAEVSDPSGIHQIRSIITNRSGAEFDDSEMFNLYTKMNHSTWKHCFYSGDSPEGIYSVGLYLEDTKNNNLSVRNILSFSIIKKPVCMIEQWSCGEGTEAVFSFSDIKDAHIAIDPGYFDGAKLCCISDEDIHFEVFDRCPGRGIISISGSQGNHNDQHVAGINKFDAKVCMDGQAFKSCYRTNAPCDDWLECLFTYSEEGLVGGHVSACDYDGSGDIQELTWRVCCERS